MHDTSESDPIAAKSEWADCLTRTRMAVLNVLIGVGLTIALSGWILRGREEAGPLAKTGRLHDVLMVALIMLAVASYLVRRTARRSAAASDLVGRRRWFYRSHVVAATIAALAAPLGLLYGFWIDPRLEAIIPFWVVALSMGLLAFPRARELDDFDQTSTDSGTSPS